MYNLEDIKRVLPHRDPFLFIEQIVEMNDESITATNVFKSDLDIYKGHFPDFPITPGVIILEAMAQTGAFLVLSKEEYKGKIAYFLGADNVKWRNPVLPNDKVVFKVSVEKFRRGIGVAQAYAYVNDKLCCEAIIKVAVK